MPDSSTTPPLIDAGKRSAANGEFVYAPGCGARKISGFQNGIDTIDLRAFSFGSLENVLDKALTCQAGITIDLGNGDSLTIEDAYMAQFDASDFSL